MWQSFKNSAENNGIHYLQLHYLQQGDISHDSKGDQVSRIYLGGLIWGTAVSYNNRIYVGSTNRRFYCIENNEIKWKYKLKTKNDSLIDSAAAIHPRGFVVVPGGDGYLYALNLDNGNVMWTFKAHHVSDTVDASGVIVNSFEGNVKIDRFGRIYAGSDNSYMYCLDGTGRELWSFETKMMIWTCACLFHEDQYVAFGSLDFHMYVLETKTGRLVAKYNTGAEVKASIVNVGNKLICCNSNGNVFCFDVPTLIQGHQRQALQWKIDCGTEIYSTPSVSIHTDQNILMACTMDGSIVGIDIASGSVVWSNTIYKAVCSSPVIINNVGMFGASDGYLYGVNAATGDIVLKYRLSQKDYKCALNASPCITNRAELVIGCYDGYLYIASLYLLFSQMQERIDLSPKEQGIHIRCLSNTKHIKQLQFNVYTNDSVMVRNVGVHGTNVSLSEDFAACYDASVSSDGKYINLVPNSFDYLKLVIPRNVCNISGSYFNQTNNWFMDRLQFHDHVPFVENVEIPCDHKSKTNTQKQQVDAIVKYYGSGAYVHQPAILDTYIPAAMDAQGFIMFKLGSGSVFPVLCIHAIPDDDGFVIEPDASKVFVFKGAQQDGVVYGEGTFTMSAMGGTIPLKTFKFFFDETDKTVVEYYAQAFCLSIKGNASNYKFSSDILPQICDYSMHLNIIGTFDMQRVPLILTSDKLNISRSDGTLSFNLGAELKLVVVVLYNDNDYNVNITKKIVSGQVTVKISSVNYAHCAVIVGGDVIYNL